MDQGWGIVANRLGIWATLAGLFVYAVHVGSWIGHAEEQLSDAENVEQVQQEVKERLTRVEEDIEHLDKSTQREHEMILRALEELKEKINDHG